MRLHRRAGRPASRQSARIGPHGAVAAPGSAHQSAPMPNGEVWTCAVCQCTSETANRVRARARLSVLRLDALTCGQACALALVEREIAALEAELQTRTMKLGIVNGPAETGWHPRRAAYVHV